MEKHIGMILKVMVPYPNKQLFVSVGGDGMTLDDEGHVYLCQDSVLVYDIAGDKIEEIQLPEQPTNVCFGGEDGLSEIFCGGIPTSMFCARTVAFMEKVCSVWRRCLKSNIWKKSSGTRFLRCSSKKRKSPENWWNWFQACPGARNRYLKGRKVCLD